MLDQKGFNIKHFNTKCFIYLALLLPFGVAKETKTEMSNSLENYVRELSNFNWGWHAICNTDLKDMTEIFQDNDLDIELVSLTSGILPENIVPQELLGKLLIKAREYDSKYMFDYSLFDDMHSVFFANGVKGDQIFFVYIPKRENGEANSFCFGEWRY